MARTPKVNPGQLVTVTWVDIVEDPRGNPADCSLAVFQHTYYFVRKAVQKVGDKKVRYWVFSSGKPPEYYHSVAVPESCITHIEIINVRED